MGSMNDRPVGPKKISTDFLFTRASRSSQLLSTKFLLYSVWKNQVAVNSIKKNEDCNCIRDGASLN